MRYALLINVKPGAGDALSENERQESSPSTRRSATNPHASAGRSFSRPQRPPRCASRTAGRSRPTGPSPTPRRYSAATSCSTPMTRPRARRRRTHPRGPHGRFRGGPPGRGELTLLEQAFREHWSRLLASLVGLLGDFDIAEEAAQEAFAVAAERWRSDGTPSNPGAWLYVTARNRALDRLRRERTLAAKVRRCSSERRRCRTSRWTSPRSPTSGSS